MEAALTAMNPQILYCLSPIFPCEIYFYDLKTKVCKCKTLPLGKEIKGKKYEPRISASCAMLKNNCLVCGGGHPELTDFFKESLLCSITPEGEWDFKITHVENMLMEKAEHSLCPISDDLILSVGGVYSKGVLGFCEAYSISKGTWTQYSALEVPRKQTSVCVFSGSIVYAFGGKNVKDLPITTIEKLKLGNPKNNWRTAILFNDKSFFPLAGALSMQINEESILIAGGITYNLEKSGEKPVGSTLVELEDSKKTLIFNVKSNSFTPGPDLKYATSFIVGPPVLANGIIGAIDTQMSIHLYSLGKQQWMCIRESKWNSFKFSIKAISESS